MFSHEDQDVLLRFYTDAVNSAAFDTPCSFLGKYDIADYSVVVETEERLGDILKKVVSSDAEKASKIKEVLEQMGVEEEIQAVLATVISHKIADIKREVIRKEISRGGPSLLDNNWRVISVIGNSWSANTNKNMLNLTLIIEQGCQTRPISLELTLPEAEQLLDKLKGMKRSLKV